MWAVSPAATASGARSSQKQTGVPEDPHVSVDVDLKMEDAESRSATAEPEERTSVGRSRPVRQSPGAHRGRQRKVSAGSLAGGHVVASRHPYQALTAAPVRTAPRGESFATAASIGG